MADRQKGTGTLMVTTADLEAALRSDDGETILDAAWKTFDVADRAAGAVIFDGCSDDGLAMLVGEHCAEGRSQLPFPRRPGFPETPVPGDGADWIEPYTALLRQAKDALLRLSTRPGYEEHAARLSDAAQEADLCAGLLPGIRPGDEVPS
jgi:hypothetical protein